MKKKKKLTESLGHAYWMLDGYAAVAATSSMDAAKELKKEYKWIAPNLQECSSWRKEKKKNSYIYIYEF